MPVRNINRSTYLKQPATRTWSDGRVDNLLVNGLHQADIHQTTVTPDYFEKKSRGERLPVNELYRVKDRGEACRGTMTFTDTRPNYPDAVYTGPYAWESQYGYPGNYPLASQAVWDALYARARARLLEKIKNQKVNLAQMFAERQQVSNMIASTATRLAKSYTSLRRGNLKGAAEQLGVTAPKRMEARFAKAYARNQSKASSQTWLELQYGWLPLIADVYGAAEAVADAHLGKKELQTVKTTLTEKVSPVSSTWTDGSVVKTTFGETFVTLKASCTFCYSNPALHDASALGLTNPALLAWELLPYSFVVDWFMPIGDALSNLDATLGCTFVDGYFIQVQKTNVSSVVKGKGRLTTFANGDYQDYSGTLYGSRYREAVYLERLTNFPSVEFPRFKNPFSYTHVANALALLRGAFR